VLASDIAVHREVGGNACEYFDLANPNSLAKRVLDIELRDNPSEQRVCETDNTITWRESCIDLLTKVQAMAAIATAKRTSVPRDIDFTRNEQEPAAA
jgi:hypothetical protein